MPLYDFRCEECDYREQLQMKYQDPNPKCSHCGSLAFKKQVSPFHGVGLSRKSNPRAAAKVQASKKLPHLKSGSHQQTTQCSEGGPASGAQGCSANRVDELVKKYEKTVMPTEIRSKPS